MVANYLKLNEVLRLSAYREASESGLRFPEEIIRFILSFPGKRVRKFPQDFPLGITVSAGREDFPHYFSEMKSPFEFHDPLPPGTALPMTQFFPYAPGAYGPEVIRRPLQKKPRPLMPLVIIFFCLDQAFQDIRIPGQDSFPRRLPVIVMAGTGQRRSHPPVQGADLVLKNLLFRFLEIDVIMSHFMQVIDPRFMDIVKKRHDHDGVRVYFFEMS